MLSFKAHSTAPLTRTDTLEISEPVNLDSIKALVPMGFYLLTENGARRSLQAKIDAQAFQQKWLLADTALGRMSSTVSWVTMERNQARDLNLRKDETIQQLSKKLRWATFWKYAAISAAAGLGTQLLLK